MALPNPSVAARLRWIADQLDDGRYETVELHTSTVDYGDGDRGWSADLRFTGTVPSDVALAADMAAAERRIAAGNYGRPMHEVFADLDAEESNTSSP